MVPFLSADELRATTFVRHVEIYDSLDSTNNRAAVLARDADLDLPALIAARHQTAGRGRGANKWWSVDGALTLSLLIDPASHGVPISHWPQLSLTTAVAICDALQSQCRGHEPKDNDRQTPLQSANAARCSIKWPNDVLINGRKIAGILLESPGGCPPTANRLIIGIGININNSLHSSPPNACDTPPSNDVLQRAIALRDVTGLNHNLQQVLTDLLRALTQRIAQLVVLSPRLPSAWQQLSSLTNQVVTVTNDGHSTTGRCLGIATDGALVIEMPDGPRCFHSGSVRLA